jgi:hypothetical protein
MEAIRSSETSVDTQRTTRRYIPEYGTLQNYSCENLKSYMSFVVFSTVSKKMLGLNLDRPRPLHSTFCPIRHSSYNRIIARCIVTDSIIKQQVNKSICAEGMYCMSKTTSSMRHC